jgi:hypothetical protein
MTSTFGSSFKISRIPLIPDIPNKLISGSMMSSTFSEEKTPSRKSSMEDEICKRSI